MEVQQRSCRYLSQGSPTIEVKSGKSPPVQVLMWTDGLGLLIKKGSTDDAKETGGGEALKCPCCIEKILLLT